jgi:uncharacterized UBP type Zn finger protein
MSEINPHLRPLLGALGQKYDQYLDFAQQDAHEFLRILLDAMRMEEFDVRGYSIFCTNKLRLSPD